LRTLRAPHAVVGLARERRARPSSVAVRLEKLEHRPNDWALSTPRRVKMRQYCASRIRIHRFRAASSGISSRVGDAPISLQIRQFRMDTGERVLPQNETPPAAASGGVSKEATLGGGHRWELVTLRPSHAVLRSGADPSRHAPTAILASGSLSGALTVRATAGKVKWPGQVIDGILCLTWSGERIPNRFTRAGDGAWGGDRLE
jgi:hypothetical protein